MRAPRRVGRWLALAAASGSLASILSARGAFADPAILAAAPAAVLIPLHSGLCATQARHRSPGPRPPAQVTPWVRTESLIAQSVSDFTPAGVGSAPILRPPGACLAHRPPALPGPRPPAPRAARRCAPCSLPASAGGRAARRGAARRRRFMATTRTALVKPQRMLTERHACGGPKRS
jgi:hypothetical protein